MKRLTDKQITDKFKVGQDPGIHPNCDKCLKSKGGECSKYKRIIKLYNNWKRNNG